MGSHQLRLPSYHQLGGRLDHLTYTRAVIRRYEADTFRLFDSGGDRRRVHDNVTDWSRYPD